MDITFFQHSPFLDALGKALLNSLWQSFLLWIIYETIILTIKHATARIKHNLSVLVVFSSFFWFVITLISKLPWSHNISTLNTEGNNIGMATNHKITWISKILYFYESILPYLSVAYILLLLLLMVKLFMAYRRVHNLAHKNLMSPPEILEDFASQMAGKPGFPKKIKIWISNHIEVPATIGYLKPVILIPFASVNQLTVHQLEAIILHELSHIKRNDYLINLLVSIVETILFFNPFIAFFIKIIKRERENCCDDFVLKYQYDPHSYATALLKLEQSRNKNIQLALGAVSGKKQLLTRIKRINGDYIVNQFNYGQKLLALLITTAIFCSLAWVSPFTAKKAFTGSSTKSENSIISRTYNIVNSTRTNEVEKNVQSIEKNKTPQGQQLIRIKEEIITSKPGTMPDSGTAVDTEKRNTVERKVTKDSKSSDQDFLSELDQNFIKGLIFKSIPKISIGNLGIKVNKEIDKSLMKAGKEINQINWGNIQNEINQSLSGIHIEQLSENEKAEIAKVKTILSLLKINRLPYKSIKVIKKMNRQSQIIIDTLDANATTLTYPEPEIFHTNSKRKSIHNPNILPHHFVFSPSNEFELMQIHNDINNIKEEKHKIELKDKMSKKELPRYRTNTSVDILKTTDNKIKESHRIIIEI